MPAKFKQVPLRFALIVGQVLVCIQIAAAQDSGAPVVLPPPGALPSPGPAPTFPTAAFSAPELPTPVVDPIANIIVENRPEPTTKIVEVILETEPMWYQTSRWFGPAPWDIGFELGINGSNGTNDTFSLRTGGHLKRETDFWKIDTSISHYKNTSNGLETQNNAKFDARFDRLLGESPWSLFFLTNVLYDEFQPFDIRLALNSGAGYQFLDTERVDLTGRFGAGASREFGGPDDRWAQEALFGLEYEHKLSKTQRLTAKVDYFPEWKDFGLYRVVTDLGWQINLDRPKNVSLKLSVQDRYDSTPNGVDPNNLDYALLLIWGL